MLAKQGVGLLQAPRCPILGKSRMALIFVLIRKCALYPRMTRSLLHTVGARAAQRSPYRQCAAFRQPSSTSSAGRRQASLAPPTVSFEHGSSACPVMIAEHMQQNAHNKKNGSNCVERSCGGVTHGTMRDVLACSCLTWTWDAGL